MTKINLYPNANIPPRDERDLPLPSTESPPAPFLFGSRSSSTSENEFSFRTPSISVSPIPNPERREYTTSPIPSARDYTSTQLCDAVAQLGVNGNGGLSDFQDLSSALNDESFAETPRAARPGLTVLPEDGDRSRGSTRRRSSSNIKRYDVSVEEPPRDVFNSPEFQSALLGTKALAGELAEVLSSSPLHREEDSKMHELHKTAVALADFRPTATRVVGFVGGAGAGKSSVLNSLLDEGDLVKSGSAGGACTCAATEFHYHDSDTISIEVQLFDEDALLEQQMQLLKYYRHFHLECPSEDDRDYFYELAMLATDTFSSLFQSQLPSQNTLLNEDEGRMKRTFKRLITELRPPSSHTVMTGLTKEACSEKLTELTSTPASSAGDSATRAAVWPYIEKIRVFLNAQILKKGLILVDLPGLRDINSARRNITEVYIRNCNEIFAVCPASRASDDETIQEIFRMAEHLESISIICTNSEVQSLPTSSLAINGKECQKDWPGERAATIKKQLKAIEKHRKNIEQLKEDLDEELQNFPDEENRFHEDNRRINKLRESILKSQKTEESCQFELQSFLIKCRNGDLVKSLHRKYRTGPASADTKVFCVSNTLYQEKRQAKIEIALPYLKLSGIIDLRRHCVSIVSANQHRAASAFMKTDVPKLLAAIDLWVQSGVNTWDGEIRAAVRSALDDTLNHRAPSQQISKVLCQIFKAEVYDRRRVNEWSESAYSAASQWSVWYHSTYSAFCRQYGNYSTPAAGHHDWNGEANRQMAQDMKTPWQTFVSFVQAEETRIAELLTTSTDSVLDSLDNHPIGILATMSPLRHALDLEQSILLDTVQNAHERANLQLRKLRTDAFSSLRTSYIGVAMESSYDACNYESGTGSDGRRKAIITGAFGNEALFDDIMQKLRTGFKELATTAQNDVTAAVKSYLSEIGKTMNLLRDENTAVESQRDIAFHERVSDALKTSQETLRDISRPIEA
ncbi:Dynamin, GTPase domain protein [Cordyceps fumosorosea ARSEF 2679]|uniref:Dynamin, GTPase domain protein n=1 Tax=Cordyceps fumosorosea (strain ARSEF 2679) TaxID=1081104 RepID=A0A162J9E5_CORFA|nr:Dynamin, GTPase domain protein [Cordyceps fumosorosea ARSEF 2679]OAA41248.1 Dynamin, GTPase domain protein [Cordyceps fumosorosea ARSEF 2679]